MFTEIALIASKKDLAGLNIRDSFLELSNFAESGSFDNNPVFEGQIDGNKVRVYTVNEETVFLNDLDKKIDAELFIFMTKHRSTSGIPSLSAHSPGNWATAELGGISRKLGLAPACYLKQALCILEELGKNSGYDIVQECTHHGPFIYKPCFFIEIGSDEDRWKDKKAGKIIAQTLARLLSSEIKQCRAAFGIGGPHTLPNFKKIILNSDIAIAHVCPKYMLEHLDKELVIQALKQSIPESELIILDWKGLAEYKEKVKRILDEVLKDFENDFGKKIEIKKTKDF